MRNTILRFFLFLTQYHLNLLTYQRGYFFFLKSAQCLKIKSKNTSKIDFDQYCTLSGSLHTLANIMYLYIMGILLKNHMLEL